MMRAWWSGTRLVWERGVVDNVRSKTFRIVMALLLVLSAAAVIVPSLLAGGVTTYTLATVGTAPASLVAAMDAAELKGSFSVEYVTRDSADEVRAAVQAGDATVGLGEGVLYAAAEDAGTFPVVVAQARADIVAAAQQTQRIRVD